VPRKTSIRYTGTRKPGNPGDVTIVLLVSNNNNNRKRKKQRRRRRRRTIINQCKSGTHTSTVILTSLASLWKATHSNPKRNTDRPL
jgi:hypothetical protein